MNELKENIDKNQYNFLNCMWSWHIDNQAGFIWECQLRNIRVKDKTEAVNTCFECKCFQNTLTEEE